MAEYRDYPYHGPWLRQSSHTPISPGFYDVVVWRWWPSFDLPSLADHVQASSPYAAIEQTMRAYGLRSARHASAAPCGGQAFQVYRAFGIRLD